MNEFDEKMHFYRQRRARNISLAVMGYFIAVVCLIARAVMGEFPGTNPPIDQISLAMAGK